MQRPIWRGQLRLALVSCPVALYAAHHDRAALHFNLLNPKTGHRIRMVSVDAQSGQEVERADLVKGYEYQKGHYLVVDDADFDSARVPSSATLTIERFVPSASIDPIYFDSSYYVGPDEDSGADVFAVLRDAIAASGMAALSHVVIARRERVVALMPMGTGLVAHTLHEARDLNSASEVFGPIPTTPSDPEMVQLATQLIARQTGTYDPAEWDDRYEARLRKVIEAKVQGKGLAPAEDEPDATGNVVDLMAALKQSLGGAVKAKPKPARATKKPARKRA